MLYGDAMKNSKRLFPPQGDDDSFRHSSNLVKEDDPLIATAFAVHVLARPESRSARAAWR